MGGGAQSALLIFFVKTIEYVLRLCIVSKKKKNRGGCEDRPLLWAFFTNLSLETIYLSPELREKWRYLSNYQSKNFFFNTVHNLITFSMVFTNKNRGGTLCPPPLS